MTDALQNVSEKSTLKNRGENIMEDSSSERSSDLVCGVEKSLVERFLLLIRENYKKADRATFYLEQRTGVVNLPGITNLRDVLSHLVTFLSPETPNEKRNDQLINAEEHIRRAIIEPYEIALNELTVKFEDVYQDYKRNVLPNKDKDIFFSTAPGAVEIERVLQEIRQLTSQGRIAKGRNLWDAEWDKGVAQFIEAYDKLYELKTSMEGYVYRYKQSEEQASKIKQIEVLEKELHFERERLNHKYKRIKLIATFGIIWAVISMIIALFIAWQNQ